MKKLNTIITGSVLAAGVAASLFGAGTASAAPGVSVSVDGNPAVGIGDQSATGAKAISTKGNAALAVSVIGPAHATAAGGHGNGAAALLGGQAAVFGQNPVRNQAVTVGGVAAVSGNVKDNHVLSVLSVVSSTGSTNNTVAFCGGSLSAQSASLSTYKLPAGSGSLC